MGWADGAKNAVEPVTLSATEAKACPFCGNQPEIEPWHGGGPQKKLVSCQSNKCWINPGITGPSRKTALNRWNYRA